MIYVLRHPLSRGRFFKTWQQWLKIGPIESFYHP